jgi:hypothetical protein
MRVNFVAAFSASLHLFDNILGGNHLAVGYVFYGIYRAGGSESPHSLILSR